MSVDYMVTMYVVKVHLKEGGGQPDGMGWVAGLGLGS